MTFSRNRRILDQAGSGLLLFIASSNNFTLTTEHIIPQLRQSLNLCFPRATQQQYKFLARYLSRLQLS